MKNSDSFFEKHFIGALIFQLLTIVSAIFFAIYVDFDDIVRFNNNLADIIVEFIFGKMYAA